MFSYLYPGDDLRGNKITHKENVSYRLWTLILNCIYELSCVNRVNIYFNLLPTGFRQ